MTPQYRLLPHGAVCVVCVDEMRELNRIRCDWIRLDQILLLIITCYITARVSTSVDIIIPDSMKSDASRSVVIRLDEMREFNFIGCH